MKDWLIQRLGGYTFDEYHDRAEYAFARGVAYERSKTDPDTRRWLRATVDMRTGVKEYFEGDQEFNYWDRVVPPTGEELTRGAYRGGNMWCWNRALTDAEIDIIADYLSKGDDENEDAD